MENVAAIANNIFLNVIIFPTGFFNPPFKCSLSFRRAAHLVQNENATSLLGVLICPKL